MKILHTSDWHLGQKFLFREREEEHQLALSWLTGVILREKVDVLLVSGDIFDIGNPPNTARRMYYRFLTGLLNSCCRHVVIVGGNHDSPGMLNAPKDLLEALNVYVVGAVPEDLSEELLVLKDHRGNPEAVVAAVPFLRDRDLRYSIAGESGLDRIERIKEGILQHYQSMAELAAPFQDRGIPVIATGHLYASGAVASDKQDNIYIGNVENIEAKQFPSVFQYVALGHIHRAQIVEKHHHIRYSGSLIPLSFSETKDEKGVQLISFDKDRLVDIRFMAAPTFRRLKTIRGNLAEVEEKLLVFSRKEERGLLPWVEVIVETDQPIPQLDLRLKDLCREMPLELMKIRLEYSRQARQQQEEEDLTTLEVEEVFQKKCLSYGSPPEEMEELVLVFRELQNWIKEREDEI